MVGALWTPLMTRDLHTNEMEYGGVAESIETTDSVNYTIALKPGWTFHDGSPVTADSYIKAWNYTANPHNAFIGANTFSVVKGYEELSVTEDPEAGLSGLRKVDDATFTVELNAPFGPWLQMSGANALMPLPEIFYDDPEAFGKKPIGNGPFKTVTEFNDNTGIVLERYDDYAGTPAKAEALEYRIITSRETAYLNAQSGEIDVSRVPVTMLGSASAEFGDRFVTRESAWLSSLSFPMYDARFEDKRVRQAFSMAMDREAIVKAVFGDTSTPALSAVPPAMPGAREDACQYCVFDPEGAKELLAQTDFDTSVPIELWYDTGNGHENWIQAIGNQWKQNLGVEYKVRSGMVFADFLEARDNKQVTGPFRSGWVGGVPLDAELPRTGVYHGGAAAARCQRLVLLQPRV